MSFRVNPFRMNRGYQRPTVNGLNAGTGVRLDGCNGYERFPIDVLGAATGQEARPTRREGLRCTVPSSRDKN